MTEDLDFDRWAVMEAQHEEIKEIGWSVVLNLRDEVIYVVVAKDSSDLTIYSWNLVVDNRKLAIKLLATILQAVHAGINMIQLEVTDVEGEYIWEENINKYRTFPVLVFYGLLN